MIFHGDEPAAGRTHVFGERGGIDRFDAIKIEHANADSARLEFIASLKRFVNRNSRSDYRDAVVRAFPQYLQAGRRKSFVIAIQNRSLRP